jgi:hypothetical protein
MWDLLSVAVDHGGICQQRRPRSGTIFTAAPISGGGMPGFLVIGVVRAVPVLGLNHRNLPTSFYFASLTNRKRTEYLEGHDRLLSRLG